ncbi:HAD family hydrolase [Paenibacillus eucommiae]|uniref:2-haloacid dehalogenase/putative hydrolase of the HAD superfamily n=1 Tax=Paenibacillus eucommiae TaxID=1355755 RepID=A0ABS4ISM9_9BACL|nr:HAD family hydrolase [Paenibacillus eucommiae]MBP1990576.1 2-haloacid dehalogenase/putative hydrolase of the HAD superfamily [Paenibacillus eucommiae]
MYKAIFLDFYGTVVHEDDDIIPVICQEIMNSTEITCTPEDVGSYWWKAFLSRFQNSFGATYETQRVLGIKSLSDTINYFKSTCEASQIIQKQFEFWKKPAIFADSLSFLEEVKMPIYILSNIDSDDLAAAMKHHHIQAAGIITSEDVQAYKPRPEMFKETMKRFHLTNDEVVHIGDSLISDVQGAQGAGIKAVWLNRKKKAAPEHIKPDYVFGNLLEVKAIL